MSLVAKKEQKLDGKMALKEHMEKVLKVWQSFVKFISSQVVNNNRCVDTQLIGLIFKDESKSVVYLPSADFLEEGRFKFKAGNESVDASRPDAL